MKVKKHLKKLKGKIVTAAVIKYLDSFTTEGVGKDARLTVKAENQEVILIISGGGKTITGRHVIKLLADGGSVGVYPQADITSCE